MKSLAKRVRLNGVMSKPLEPVKLEWLLLSLSELNCELGCKI